jgi:diacylglycerol kinase (ATP)
MTDTVTPRAATESAAPAATETAAPAATDSAAPAATDSATQPAAEAATNTAVDSATQPAAGDATATRVAAVVYNPIKVDLDEIKAAVAAEQKSSGWSETLWYETTVDDPGQGQTKEALEAGANMIIAAGGDGTVGAVAEALYGSNASLALLPSGTGNLLARNLDLTLADVEHAVHTAFTGQDRAIDLAFIDIKQDDGSITRRTFLVMAGLGLDASMLAHTDDELKKKVGWLAYVSALGKAMRDKDQLHLRYSLDGSPTKRITAHTIIVGNCGSLPANILLLPEAAVDDGAFEIVVLRPKGLFGWLQITGKIIWENGVLRRTEIGRKLRGLTKDVRALRYVKGRKLIVELDRAYDIELDGDSCGKARAFTTWVEPGGLTVRVPAGE